MTDEQKASRIAELATAVFQEALLLSADQIEQRLAGMRDGDLKPECQCEICEEARYTASFRPLPNWSGPPPIRRFARLLKAALRLGFKCVSVREENSTHPPPRITVAPPESRAGRDACPQLPQAQK
jgi:hypothetical protein